MASEMIAPTMKPKPSFAEILMAGSIGLMLSYATLYLCIVPLLPDVASGRDFVAYWATGQQLIHHASPYDAAAMARIEHTAGFTQKNAVGFMRNPPWGLLLTLPLGLTGVRTGALLWSVLLLACLAFSVRMLWLMHKRPLNIIPWLVASFAPALLGLTMGQTSLFALLGYVLFLRFHQSRPFLAGVCLWLCTLKPHLLLVLGVVLFAWILVSKNYKILLGAIAALTASCAVTTCIDPAAWVDYQQMLRTGGIQKEFIPCLSIVLRLWISPRSTWIQYLPAAMGCGWGLSFFWPRRHSWNWMRDGNLLMLVSILLAPYCWLFDQTLAIPALMYGAYRTRSRILLVVLALASPVILIELLFCGVTLQSPSHLWMAPFWLAWYLCATRIKTRPAEILCNNTAIAE